MGDKTFNGLLDEKAVAKILNVSIASLRRWRMMKIGPDFIRVGGHIRYGVDAVEDYLTSCAVKCNSARASALEPRARRRECKR